jgi:hypothetical protein
MFCAPLETQCTPSAAGFTVYNNANRPVPDHNFDPDIDNAVFRSNTMVLPIFPSIVPR